VDVVALSSLKGLATAVASVPGKCGGERFLGMQADNFTASSVITFAIVRRLIAGQEICVHLRSSPTICVKTLCSTWHETRQVPGFLNGPWMGSMPLIRSD
jgi:hypothetical protein